MKQQVQCPSMALPLPKELRITEPELSLNDFAFRLVFVHSKNEGYRWSAHTQCSQHTGDWDRTECNVSTRIVSEVYRAQHSAQCTAHPPTYLYRYSQNVNRLNLQGVKGVCMCIDCTIILHDFLPKHVWDTLITVFVQMRKAIFQTSFLLSFNQLLSVKTDFTLFLHLNSNNLFGSAKYKTVNSYI